MMDLCNFIFMIILSNIISESLSQINYNQECYKAIRKIGLPRKWKNDFNDTPLVLPLSVDQDPKDIIDSRTNAVDTWLQRSVPLLSCLNQDSPQLIRAIKEIYLDENKNGKKPYNLAFSTQQFHSNPRKFADKQALEVDDLIFKGKLKDGFFIEAGGHDFQDQSTSLYFELKYNWTGLLVEPNPVHYKKGLKTKRRVYSAETCFSFSKHPTIMQYDLYTESTKKKGDGVVKVQCLPLYSLLQAVGSPTVNYMSLDIEGGEFQVLQTIPWELVDIQAFSIESHFLGVRSAGNLENVIDFMKDKHYKHIPGAHKKNQNDCMNAEVLGVGGQVSNELFVREDIAKEAGL